MIHKKYFLVVIGCITINFTNAQTKNLTNWNQFWYGYNNNTRLSTNWGIWLDIQNKTKEDFFSKIDVKENI